MTAQMKVKVKRWRKPASELTPKGRLQRAWYIHNNPDAPQDIDIMCPVHADGQKCIWVAGHPFGHQLG